MDKLSIQVKIGNDSFNASGTAQQVWQAFDLWLIAVGHPRPVNVGTWTVSPGPGNYPVLGGMGMGAASAQGF